MSGYRILLADDEQTERMALAKWLSWYFGDSLDISKVANGAEALEVFGREQNQIVIMDIFMPEMNGVEVAERIRSMGEDCIIVFLTACDDFTYAKRAIVIHVLGYLLRLCDEEELVSVMEKAMRLTDRREGRKQAMETGRAGGGAAGESAGRVAGGAAGASVGRSSGGVAVGSSGGVPGDRVGGQNLPMDHGEEGSGTGRIAQIAETMREYIRNNYMKETPM